jgi:hypothetical protein
MAVEIAQIETVDEPIWRAQSADPLRRLRLAGFVLIKLVVIHLWLKLRFAPMPLDAVAVQHPKCRPREKPTQQHHVAVD